MNRATALSLMAGALVPSFAGVPVFMYHHVNDTHPSHRIALGLTFPTAAFEEQLRYLAEHRIATITASELVEALAGNERPERVATLTFDDGYADAATIVKPLLDRYRARATFFVNASTIGLRNHVTYRDLRAMIAAGNEIGAHGMHHLDLAKLDRRGQLHEAGDCADRIERYAGVRPVSYAYASGAYDATTLDVMREIGMHSAWTEHPGRARDLERPFEMPRLRVARTTTIQEFASLLGG